MADKKNSNLEYMQNLINQLKQFKYQTLIVASLIVLGGILVWLVRQPAAQPQPQEVKPLVKVVLTPASLDLSVGQSVVAEVGLAPTSLDEAVSLDAVDVFLSYDSEKLEIEKIEKSDLFPTYPLLTAQDGVIKISGLAWGENGVQKVNLDKEQAVAIITLKAVKNGTSKIVLTKDSVVAQNGNNILDLNKLSETVIKIKE